MVKVISIQDDVYEELSKRKANKSFSTVIRSLLKETEKRPTIGDLVKAGPFLSNEQADKMKKEIHDARKHSESRNITEVR